MMRLINRFRASRIRRRLYRNIDEWVKNDLPTDPNRNITPEDVAKIKDPLTRAIVQHIIERTAKP